jgi:hypothetical protein
VAKRRYPRKPEPPKPKLSRKWVAVILAIIVLISLIVFVVVHPTPSNKLVTVPTGAPATSYYNSEEINFLSNFTVLSFTVSAIAQQDAYGYGPAYLLNGLTNEGYWFQVGITYHWPGYSDGHYNYYKGFEFMYDVWYSNESIYPSNHHPGIEEMNIVNGDHVNLKMYFSSNGSVKMSATDSSTWSSRTVSFPGYGANLFVGKGKTIGNKEYSTCLMTSWWHDKPYNESEMPVTYTSLVGRIQYVNLSIYEINNTQSPNTFVFSNYTRSPIDLFSYTNGYTLFCQHEKIIARSTSFITD